MTKMPMRDFPEDQRNPWPLLKPTKEDFGYMPAPRPLQVAQPQPKPPQTRVLTRIFNFFGPLVKGAILGTFIFGLIYSFLPLERFWLVGFHWVYPVIVVVLLWLFIGPNITFVAVWIVSTIIALWLSWTMITTMPAIPLLIIGGIMVVYLYIRRFLPEKEA